MPDQNEPARPDVSSKRWRRAEAASATLTGACINPIRLRGYYQRIAAETGEVIERVGSPGSDATLLVSCKDRRESRCRACARLYQQDAYQLIAAGLRGRRNVPAAIGVHPALMLTLTAPSFGAVHGNRDFGQPCKCEHYHAEGDPQLGTSLDPGGYRYIEQVIWNRYAPELWRRTIQAVRRGLAHEFGMSRSKFSQIARVRFAKVAEFQRRGVVHYHAIVRVDGPAGMDAPPPAACTTELLERVVRAAVEATAVAPLDPVLKQYVSAPGAELWWGGQREVIALDPSTRTAAAGYIAKYATKATEAATGGAFITPIRSRRQIDELELGDHARALVTAAWEIGQRTEDKSFKRWAHQFGYGGHTLTKSHRYSVTFAALRAARASWRSAANRQGEVVTRSQLSYVGRGYRPRHTLTLGAEDAQAELRPQSRGSV